MQVQSTGARPGNWVEQLAADRARARRKKITRYLVGTLAALLAAASIICGLATL
ncbi:hypothetical protein [Pseudomonas sp.]|uniref:hypothetical protein n=1 Tax=Pseudomonas sp. TaxID=306 RepID=UPI00290D067A|nr:hypothetical protein [Pseudomonas sp.]MDU4254592.1 hypothetical protein [Pseudomonas sp.]